MTMIKYAKRFFALLLTLALMLSIPMPTLADDFIMLDHQGEPYEDSGEGWVYDREQKVLTLTGPGSYTFEADKIGMPMSAEVSLYIEGGATVHSASFSGSVTNYGLIENCVFHGDVYNSGTIEGDECEFSSRVENDGTIEDGTFNAEVYNAGRGVINGGIFYDAVENDGTINGGVFHAEVTGEGTIDGGTFLYQTEELPTTATFTTSVTGGGNITIRKTGSNENNITTGDVGENYTVVSSGGSLIGLYIFENGYEPPSAPYEISDEFTPLLGGIAGYEFTCPAWEEVFICAFYDDVSTASVFGEGSWIAIVAGAAVLIAAAVCLIIWKKKKTAKQDKK